MDLPSSNSTRTMRKFYSIVYRSVKQGDPLDWRGKGLKIDGLNFNQLKFINHLPFVLIARDRKEHQAMGEDLRRNSEKQ